MGPSVSQGGAENSPVSVKARTLGLPCPHAEKCKCPIPTLGPLSQKLKGQSPEIYVWTRQLPCLHPALRLIITNTKLHPRMSQLTEYTCGRAWLCTGLGRNGWRQPSIHAGCGRAPPCPIHWLPQVCSVLLLGSAAGRNMFHNETILYQLCPS